ncbi:hypothetical protein [Spirillospora albida]|nr:hypothetical protein [Spirillospora albida]
MRIADTGRIEAPPGDLAFPAGGERPAEHARHRRPETGLHRHDGTL